MNYDQSEVSEQIKTEQLKQLFENQQLTGYEIAKNKHLSDIIKRDSTQFANQLQQHIRGKELVCQLFDLVLRPQSESNLGKEKQDKKEIVYNALEILTNQYEDFVQFVFEQDTQQNQNQNEQNEDIKNQDEDDDCVIIDPTIPQLSRNEQDQMIRKINDMSKLKPNQSFKCKILDRMFMIFENWNSVIEQTPVSYFNRIMMQFVFQKPDELMRFFYCSRDIKSSQKISTQIDKIKKISKHLYNTNVIETLQHILQLEGENNLFIQEKIDLLRTITVEVFRQQNINHTKQPNTDVNMNTNNQNNQNEDLQTDYYELQESKIQNYVSLLKILYEKLEDRYDQEKFIPVLKSHLNDQETFNKIIQFFMNQNGNQNGWDSTNLMVSLLIQILKMDQVNFKQSKLSQQNKSTTNQNNSNMNGFGFGNSKNEQSIIASYDLKLSKQIMKQIEKVIIEIMKKLSSNKNLKTSEMVSFYELIYSWLNIKNKDEQQKDKIVKSTQTNSIMKEIFTQIFINQCIQHIKLHPKSTVLHNVIKNIFVSFLPKVNQILKIILSSQCILLPFVQRQLEESLESKQKRNHKCYVNQVYHIAKVLVLIWEQQKMLSVLSKTYQQEQIDEVERPSHLDNGPNSPTSDGQNIISNLFFIEGIQSLKKLVAKKQEFYDHLICGDPRKIGQYQEEQSSEIIVASSFKDFFRSVPNCNQSQQTHKLSNNRYAEDNDEENQQDKQQQSKSSKFKNLRLGDCEPSSNFAFESVISPLNSNISHTFNNFDFDTLPLDSDRSLQVSEQQLKSSDEKEKNTQQMKLMQENLSNMHILTHNILQNEQNLLMSCEIQNKDKKLNNNFLSIDIYRKQELSKSVDIDGDDFQKVDSYLINETERKQSEQDLDMMSLGMHSKQGSKLSQSDDLKNMNIDKVNSEIHIDLGDSQKIAISEDSQKIAISEKGKRSQDDDLNSEFVRFYSMYLSCDLDRLYREMEE